MISKSKITYIRTLHDKNKRYQEWLFLVEWKKSIQEFIGSDYEIIEWYFSNKFIQNQTFNFPVNEVSESEIDRITTLSSNDTGVLIVKMKQWNLSEKINNKEIVIVLDSINDPGNLWTIIRIADWYGINRVIASRDTVDCYNPKVIMASMWSFSRIPVIYTDIVQYLSKIDNKIYGTFLNGENLHTLKITEKWIHIVIWNEAHGISAWVEKLITNKITIPRFGNAESLNAGVATAIVLDRIVWWLHI